jgi:hypothetical protein
MRHAEGYITRLAVSLSYLATAARQSESSYEGLSGSIYKERDMSESIKFRPCKGVLVHFRMPADLSTFHGS